MTISRRDVLKLGAAAGAAGAFYAASPRLDSYVGSVRASPANTANSWADSYSGEVAWKWFELLYDVVKREGTGPPPASRIYGIAGVAIYQSIVQGSKHLQTLAGQLNGLSSTPRTSPRKKLHWPSVANAALADTVRGLYPAASTASRSAINALELSLTASPADEGSVSYGRAIAAAVVSWAAGDGLSSFNNCPYVPVPVAGAWEPTPPTFNANPSQPCWGELRPMVLSSGAQAEPEGHPAFSTSTASSFYLGALEVHDVGTSLTAEQRTIADYWADGAGATGTPPGHWVAIVSQIVRNDALSLVEAAEAYARVGIAVHDAFICCWHVKFDTNLQRPVTYINDQIDPDWMPYITTPPFPTYTSGHSTQSGAAATVLADMFGQKGFTDTTHSDQGLSPAQQPRTFKSFAEAAAEAAVSRLYGGIHYTFDNEHGLQQGNSVGSTIVERVTFDRRGIS